MMALIEPDPIIKIKKLRGYIGPINQEIHIIDI